MSIGMDRLEIEIKGSKYLIKFSYLKAEKPEFKNNYPGAPEEFEILEMMRNGRICRQDEIDYIFDNYYDEILDAIHHEIDNWNEYMNGVIHGY